MVELGVHNGFSFFVFCQFFKDNITNGRCYAIDHWQGDEHAGFYDDGIYQQFISHHESHYNNMSEVLKTTFDEALISFEDASIDLLHIDGRHFYDDVKHDFNQWKTKLKKDAIVLFHDTQVKENNFGVHQYWAELQKEYSLTFEFMYGHGLGVLCFGDGATLPERLKRFFALKTKQKEKLSLIYKALGNQIHFEYLLEAYNIPFFND